MRVYNIINIKIIMGIYAQICQKGGKTVENTQKSLLFSPVTSLAGVGKTKAAAYERIGVRDLDDLIHHYPRAYENRGDIHTLFEASMRGGKCAVVLTVATEVKRNMIRRGMTLLKFRAYDDSGTAEITFFNQDFLRDKFPLGSTFRFYGRVERSGKNYKMSSPVYEYFDEVNPPAALVPLYSLTEGLSQKQVSTNVASALDLALAETSDHLPPDVIEKHRLPSIRFAMKNIHRPDDYRSLAAAKRRLVFDEFFSFALAIAMSKSKSRPTGAPICKNTDLSEFLAALPFRLTDAQARAVKEILTDMKNDVPMNRMVVGDVGCGKTVCAAAAMYVAVKNGRQAVLMAPTEILARQHHADLSDLFGRLGISCALLIGATTAAQKKKIKTALAASSRDERIDVVIGTTALLSDGVEFAAPGIVVTDEQHRFGVDQRASLAGKCDKAHLLVMSATPIPRSMALIMYGDLDVSRIDGMPPGRQRVDTFAVDESYRERLEKFIEKQVAEGGQVYVVCPAVEERDEDEIGNIDLSNISTRGDDAAQKNDAATLKTAVEYSSELASRHPSLRIAYMHGRMKSADKERVMRDFADGKTDVLVSTTVIEVGVNVPNACLMIVENADRFGLSQLHQLRGRVGRGKRKSFCVLVSDAAGKEGSVASMRIKSLCSLYDGYAIAEQDLVMRGPGDFFRSTEDDSIRQSGGIKLPLAEQCDDASLMSSAFSEASALLSSDRTLSAHPALRKRVLDMFEIQDRTMN